MEKTTTSRGSGKLWTRIVIGVSAVISIGASLYFGLGLNERPMD